MELVGKRVEVVFKSEDGIRRFYCGSIEGHTRKEHFFKIRFDDGDRHTLKLKPGADDWKLCEHAGLHLKEHPWCKEKKNH